MTKKEKMSSKEMNDILLDMMRTGEKERVVKGVKIRIKDVEAQDIPQGH